MPTRDHDQDEDHVVIGPRSHVRIGLMVVVVGGFVGLVTSLVILAWNAANFTSRISTDMSWVKTSLATLVTRFDQVEQLKQQVDRIERFGSTSAQESGRRILDLENRIKVVEEVGSPWGRKMLDQLKSEIELLKANDAKGTPK